MKKLIPLLLLISLLLTSCASENPPKKKKEETVKVVQNPYITYAEGVTQEMAEVDYWTKDDKVLLDKEQIKAINEKNAPHYTFTDSEKKEETVYLKDIGDNIPGEMVVGMINSCDMPTVGEYFDKFGFSVNEEFVKKFDDNRNVAAVAETVIVKYGVCIKRDVLLCSPINEPFYDTTETNYYDCNISAEAMPGDGLIILHTSADGNWYFALADSYVGWVPVQSVAFCANREEWEKALKPEKFLTVTAERMQIDAVIDAPNTFCETAYMGMKLALTESKQTEINGRTTFGAYCVKLPAKDSYGNLQFIDATIAVSQDVTVGFLPCTSKNILNQAFKFLGHTYGWGGTSELNDCSGIARQIYRCFGINTPRNSGDIIAMEGFKTTTLDEKATEKERIDAIRTLKAGSLMAFRGHVMIYLGTKEDRPFCISSCGYFAPNSENGKENPKTANINSVTLNPLDVVSPNGKSWLERISTLHSPA